MLDFAVKLTRQPAEMRESDVLKLRELGLTGPQRHAALGVLVGRMAAPASELATWIWLRERSGLGELLGCDFETMGLSALYRAGDILLRHREALEARLFSRAMRLFGQQTTVTLIDLTNTYFEGDAKAQPKAKRGRSKEKRSDCPLLTLGVVLDGSGFVRRSQVLPGNVAESGTLEGMLEQLQVPADAVVVMDKGIATEDNVAWLRRQSRQYVVASRERKREFEADKAVAVKTARRRVAGRRKGRSWTGLGSGWRRSCGSCTRGCRSRGTRSGWRRSGSGSGGCGRSTRRHRRIMRFRWRGTRRTRRRSP